MLLLLTNWIEELKTWEGSQVSPVRSRLEGREHILEGFVVSSLVLFCFLIGYGSEGIGMMSV